MSRRNRRREPISVFLAPRSTRSLEEAFALAGLPDPGSALAASEAYLTLLVEGIDHADVGSENWMNVILVGAFRVEGPAAERLSGR